MAAGLGFKTFAVGEVLSAANVNGYLMQGVLVFASAAARDAAITSPQEGQFAYTKDTNGLWYYDGATWVASGATGDIEGVTAGTGISGGGTSGTVTITNSMATAIDAKGDLVVGTGADTFSKLTVGANDTILTADSTTATGLKWAAAAGGGGANWSLLNSGGTALTGSQTVTVSGISGKDKILILLAGAGSASASSYIGVRINTDSGTNYTQRGSGINGASSWASGNVGTFETDSAQYIYVGGMSGATGSTIQGYVQITGCNSSGVKAFTLNGSGTPTGNNGQWAVTGGGVWTVADTVTSVSAYSGTGNFDSGTMYVYASA